ncbi:MAG: diacylglycerol kinase family protein [Salinisphaera sp.]|jgi:diacylglycerol kinase family enzyme|nr:diacylglycerol kinase family protein [Salinisphaera sp.]
MNRPDRSVTPRRLGIIYNSQSGRHRRRWGRHPLPTGVPAVEANTPAEIEIAVATMAKQGIDLLAVAGGDGTVQCVLTHLLLGEQFDKTPILALVPTGSTNMTGHDVGHVQVRRRGWDALCTWAAHPETTTGRVQSRAVLRIQAGDRGTPFCGMFFGAGAIHHAVQYTQKQLHSVGLRGEIGPGFAFLRFLKAVATGDRRDFAPTHLRLTDDADRHIEQDTLLVAVSTLHRLVLHFHPFWGRESAPIAWTTVADDARHFLLRLPLVARGLQRAGVNSGNGYVSHRSQALTLDFDGGFIVDGEFFEARRSDGPIRLRIAGHVDFLSL